MARAVDDSLVGTTLGSYTLSRKIGEGAMGLVFEGRTRSGERAAIKVVRAELMKSPESLARFGREAKTLQAVDHENVVRLIDVGQEDGLVYIALELVEGETLEKRIARVKRLGTADATRLAIDLFRGLAAMHDQGIIHRDLKPANLLISTNLRSTQGGSWKIADFGLARRDEKEESIVLTKPGALLGTPHYMAPEQCRGEPLEARSDLYSAGATLYHAIAGEPPFVRAKVMEILAAHCDAEPADLTVKVPSAPRDLAKLIKRCLAKEPGDRPKNAREALEALGIKDAPSSERRTPPPAISPVEAPPDPEASKTPTERVRIAAPLTIQDSALPPEKLGTKPPTPSTTASGTRLAALSTQAALAPEAERRMPVRPEHVSPRWSKAFLPCVAAAAIGTAKVLINFQPGVFEVWLSHQYPRLPLSIQTHVTQEDVVGLVVGYAVFLVPGLAAIGAFRVVARYVKDNAPKSAKARSIFTRGWCRLVVLRDAKSKPVSAAAALRDLGEPDAAADLLLNTGNGALAAEDFLRAQNLVAAAQIFERIKEPVRAIDAYVAAGMLERAANVAYTNARYEEAGRLFASVGALDRAVEAYKRGNKVLGAVNVLDNAGRFLDAAKELSEALKDGKSFKKITAEEKTELLVRTGELFERAQKGLRAAPFFEEAGEAKRALSLYEENGNYAEAARIAKTLGDHARAADLWKRGKNPLEAARARAEVSIGRGDKLGAARALEEAGDHERAGDLYEEADAHADAGRCYEASGDTTHAADLYARGGDHARAAPLYERGHSWSMAALSWKQVGEHSKRARCHEKDGDALAAAEAYSQANALGDAVRVLEAITTTAHNYRESRALLGDLLAAAGRDEDAAKAYAIGLPATDAVDKENATRILRLSGVLANLGRDEAALGALARLRGTAHAPEDLDQRIAYLEERGRRGAAPSKVRPAPAPAVARPRAETGRTPARPRAAGSRDARDLVGTEIDRYRLQALIGEGATAWVFKAEHAFLRRTVAVKLLKPQPVAGDDDLAKRFLAEGQAVAALRHANVIEVYDCGVTPEGSLWIALEYVAGVSLRQLLSKTKAPLPVPQAARIGAGILAGLAAAHAAGIIHRDLKPENILLAPGDRAKVVDFGIAKVLSASHGTTTGSYLGTPRYSSPEQALGKEVVPASDQYGAGLILYEMLAGEMPFKSETPFGYLTQHASTPPAPLRSRAPQVPEKLTEAVMRALEKDPAARFPSAEAMRRAVVPFAPRGPSPSQSTSGD